MVIREPLHPSRNLLHVSIGFNSLQYVREPVASPCQQDHALLLSTYKSRPALSPLLWRQLIRITSCWQTPPPIRHATLISRPLYKPLTICSFHSHNTSFELCNHLLLVFFSGYLALPSWYSELWVRAEQARHGSHGGVGAGDPAGLLCCRGDGELRQGVRHHVGRRAWQDPKQWAAPDAGAGQDLRLRVPVQARVPLRQDRHAAEARRRQLRRHRHSLLPIVDGGYARRDRFRVPGQRDRQAVHAAHQRVHAGARPAGAAVPPLVRSHQGLPHLLHPLESQAHHLHGGRHADQGLPEPGGEGDRLPQEPAHAPLLQPLERRRLGHAGRPRQDGLVPRALLRLLPRLQGRRLRRRRRRPHALRRLRRHGSRPGHDRRCRGRRVVQPGAGPDAAAAHAVGAEQLHDLQLLHRPQARRPGPPRRVLHVVHGAISSIR